MMSSSPTGASAPAPTALVKDGAFVGQLVASLSIPVFVLDTDARVMIWNRACEQLTGVPAHEVLGTGDHWRSFYEQRRPTQGTAQRLEHEVEKAGEGWLSMGRGI